MHGTAVDIRLQPFAAAAALPAEKAAIGQFGDLAQNGRMEYSGDIFGNGKPFPNCAEGINADMPSAFCINDVELSQQLTATSVSRKLGIANARSCGFFHLRSKSAPENVCNRIRKLKN